MITSSTPSLPLNPERMRQKSDDEFKDSNWQDFVSGTGEKPAPLCDIYIFTQAEIDAYHADELARFDWEGPGPSTKLQNIKTQVSI